MFTNILPLMSEKQQLVLVVWCSENVDIRDKRQIKGTLLFIFTVFVLSICNVKFYLLLQCVHKLQRVIIIAIFDTISLKFINISNVYYLH